MRANKNILSPFDTESRMLHGGGGRVGVAFGDGVVVVVIIVGGSGRECARDDDGGE